MSRRYPVWDYNFLTPFVHKRVVYKHASEFRFFAEVKDTGQNKKYWDIQAILHGKIIELDVGKLVAKVKVSKSISGVAILWRTP